MAHSPLKMYTEFHDLHVLVSGQGPVEYIANSLGFTNVTTMDQLRHAYPALDAVDHKRRRAAPCGFEKYFPKIGTNQNNVLKKLILRQNLLPRAFFLLERIESLF